MEYILPFCTFLVSIFALFFAYKSYETAEKNNQKEPKIDIDLSIFDKKFEKIEQQISQNLSQHFKENRTENQEFSSKLQHQNQQSFTYLYEVLHKNFQEIRQEISQKLGGFEQNFSQNFNQNNKIFFENISLFRKEIGGIIHDFERDFLENQRIFKQENALFFENFEKNNTEIAQKNRQEFYTLSQNLQENIQKQQEILEKFGENVEKNHKNLQYELQTNIQNGVEKFGELILQNVLEKIQQNIKEQSQKAEFFAQQTQEYTRNLSLFLQGFEQEFNKTIQEFKELQKEKFTELSQKQSEFTQNTKTAIQDFQHNTQKIAQENKHDITQNLQKSLQNVEDTNRRNAQDFNVLQREKFENLEKKQTELIRNSEEKLEKIRQTLSENIKNLQENNEKKLEEMRITVDEKLHNTLETRLGESFKLVGDRLEQVHKGLGEMQTLATGVGDLKKVLSNVKTKGNLGEYQLEAILEQLLTPDQYAKNVKTNPEKNNLVEFAVKIPHKSEKNQFIWIPIDAKFPTEIYQNLMEAYHNGHLEKVQEYRKDLAKQILGFAKDIKEKYLAPPHTTEFGLMFLPFEGLYAEVLQNVGLFETLQREHKIIIAGATTLSALLNSLQMGFRTLAIEKRSSEVWDILGKVKSEFGKFGDLLDKTHKKLQETTNVIEDASRKSRGIERTLKNVQELPSINTPLMEDM